MNFLNSITKSTRPLPYTGMTPMPERRKTIRLMYRELEFSISEIKKVYPTLSHKSIRKIVGK